MHHTFITTEALYSTLSIAKYSDGEIGKLCYIVNAGGDGMSLSMDFVYDLTGKYALVYLGKDDLDSGCLRFLDFAID